MKRVAILLCFLGMMGAIFGQGKYDANWCFGIKAGVNFSDTAHPVNFSTWANNYNAAASISDSLGNLLYYIAPDTPFRINSALTAAYSVFDSHNKAVKNGTGIFVGSRLHNAIFLPIPDYTKEFLLFYMQELDSLVYDNTGHITDGFLFDKLFI